MPEPDLNFTIKRLGECRYSSPIKEFRFIDEDERLLYHACPKQVKSFFDSGCKPPELEMAGPRRQIFFDPTRLACGIVTCGGLCPGLNDVIRAVVLSLFHHYGVRKVHGFRYGYRGLIKRHGVTPMDLTPETVDPIDNMGGTILGSSRGPQDPAEMVDYLQELQVGVLFTLGGDGTLKGAQKIAEEALRRGYPLSVIGIPKTIDNDISYIQKTFGFETAVAEAQRAIYAAHSEAVGAPNGVTLVKLMGRDSGFITAGAALVEPDVNFCLVPEVPFTLEGFLASLQARLGNRSHAVIAVAEGAGQDLLQVSKEYDESGNLKHSDIGPFLRDAIKNHFQKIGVEVNVKYIDPSYMIRSVPANPHDSAFCLMLGQNAVHAGMSGRTDMVVGFWNHRFTHVPIALAASKRKKLDVEGPLWASVLATTGQPHQM
ncbi:MAG: ATP-dependent 6-phosphofructokinase [Deltaproteobacteria bacterium]|nr:ATP-dependent 6-phosphofructokinase [Deltaproteobacteria bacterium]